MKKLCIAAVVCMILNLTGVFYAQAGFKDRIVAVVNDEVITLSELNLALEPVRKNIRARNRVADEEKIMKEARNALLRRMIDDVLLEQEAVRLGFSVSEEEVDESIREIMEGKKISLEAFGKRLSETGSSMEEYRKQMKNHLLRMRIMVKEIRNKVTVRNEEIGDFYRDHRDAYEGKESSRIKQILLLASEEADEKTRTKARSDAVRLREMIRKGGSFDLLVGKYSQGPAAGAGGDLGFVERGVMYPSVDKVVFEMEKGEISEVIESPIGFHIVTVVDKRGAGIKPLEDVREEIKEAILKDKVEAKFLEWFAEIRQKSFIDIRLESSGR